MAGNENERKTRERMVKERERHFVMSRPRIECINDRDELSHKRRDAMTSILLPISLLMMLSTLNDDNGGRNSNLSSNLYNCFG